MEYQKGDRIAVKYGANTIEAGEFVTVDTKGAVEAGKAAKPFLGVALESTYNARGENITVLTEGIVKVKKATAAATDLGKDVKIVDSRTVDVSTTNTDIVVGKIVEIVSDNEVLVKIK